MEVEVINRRLVKFIWAAVIFFAWTCIQGIIMEQAPVREFIHLVPTGGMISGAHSHIGCSGWTALALMAIIYYLLPILSGKPIAWRGLINWVFWLWVVGVALSGALMLTAGIVAGNAFIAGITEEARLMPLIVPYMIPMGIFAYVAVIGAVMFVVQILVTLARGSKATS